MDTKRFPELLKTIYDAVDELQKMFPGRHFTPDGHMIGSIGEALAKFHYGIELSSASCKTHDGTCGERLIQVKATQRSSIGLSSCPDHLLVLQVGKEGSFTEVYNGAGARVWSLVEAKAFPKNGQHQIRLSTLKKLMNDVPDDERLPRVK